MASSDLVLVDDADPRIQYSPGWQAFENGSELDGTKHGAAASGLTASFSFTGTQVIVVGSLGSVDVHGIPTTLYALDGVEAGTYTAPIVDPGFFRLNVTFFSSKTLAPGDHTLVITNVNGTSPNVFWLDYLEYIPSADSTTTTSSSSSSSSTTTVATSSSSSSPSSSSTSSSSSQSLTTPSTPSASNRAESSTASQSTISSSTATAPPVNPTSPSNADTSTTSTSHNHAGAIAGGIVGGAALVLALALLLVYLRRRRRQKGTSALADPPIRPFGSWRGPDEAQITSPASPSSQKQMQMSVSMMAGASTPTLALTPTGLSPPASAGARPYPSEFPSGGTERQSPTSSEPASFGMVLGGGQQVGGGARGRSEPRVMMQTVDSGLRLQAGEAVMLPPPYTRE